LILQQQEDIIKFYGFEYKMVTVVAVLRNIDQTTTKITYDLEDDTARIQAHLWMEENDAQQPNIMLNTYVRVVGAVRSSGGTKTIMVFNIHPISGPNEVNTHRLEVVNARYQAEAYANGDKGAGSEKKMVSGSVKMEVDTSNLQKAVDGKDKAILELVGTYGTEHEAGCSREEIYNKFPKIPRTEIDSIIDRLSTDGNIYSTIDMDHFLACF
jgi:replication factor A2